MLQHDVDMVKDFAEDVASFCTCIRIHCFMTRSDNLVSGFILSGIDRLRHRVVSTAANRQCRKHCEALENIHPVRELCLPRRLL